MAKPGLMLATAIGDAYGACYEYCDPDPRRGRANDLIYVQNTRHRTLKPGFYTDDTQMAIAVAEQVLAHAQGNADAFSREAFADAFVQAFQRDPRVGYSRRMQDFIESCRTGADMLARIQPNSAKSGAAMRSGSLALLSSLGEIKGVARLQARITHDTPGGVLSSTAVGLAGFALKSGACAREQLPEWLSRNMEVSWTRGWTKPVGSQGMDSVRAAVSLVSEHTGYPSLLRAGVALTGDVDTVLAVACGLLSWTDTDDMPSNLIEGLENGSFGRSWLENLDRKLEIQFGYA